MKFVFLLCLAGLLLPGEGFAQSYKSDVAPLIKASCIQCHDADSTTDLDLTAVGHDLSDSATRQTWERVFDRIANGEMPPKTEDKPDPKLLKAALSSLKRDLRTASLAHQRKVGRVPARRLTKLELGYTLRDLLLIDTDVTSGVPNEVEAGNLDTVGANQRISAVHMESYLRAAGDALETAIQTGDNPYHLQQTDFAWLQDWHDKELNLGGGITRELKSGKGIALFRDVDYLTKFQFRPPNARSIETEPRTSGLHRLTAEIAAFQTDKPVTAKFIVKGGGSARIVKAIDLKPEDGPQKVIVETVLRTGEMPYLTFDMQGVEPFTALMASGGSKEYKGRGLAIYSQTVEGPIHDSWPPDSTVNLLRELKIDGDSNFEEPDDPLLQINRIVKRLALRIFRRPVDDDELKPFIELAKPALAEERSTIDALQVVLRSMLSSPQFLFFDSNSKSFDDYALANRLSYFLWRSMPDDELFQLAESGDLSDSETLLKQVDRMLADEKSQRFVQDFLGQWLQLYKLNATSPDDKLYPEFDELLAKAISREPELFFTELLDENLSLTNLIDSDFTFVNRRLAKHYGIKDIKGQEFQKVGLEEGSVRGGVLTQAAILKTSANGTTTSPVTRGNYVLTNILGTPPSPPPPDIGSIEPDTRGKTTIREILAAHRDNETCNQCHKEIDPPGFALESFDVIGGFRTKYRASGGGFGALFTGATYKNGPDVDPGGVTSDGRKFSGIKQFKQYLLDDKEQIAKNFVSQLIVYSTGAEIQFADRDQIQSILDQTRPKGFPVKDIVKAVVASQLFRSR